MISKEIEVKVAKYLEKYGDRQPAEVIASMERGRIQAERKLSELPDVEVIKEARDASEQEYKREVQLAFQREDGGQIAEHIKWGKQKTKLKAQDYAHIDVQWTVVSAISKITNFEIDAAKQASIVRNMPYRGRER